MVEFWLPLSLGTTLAWGMGQIIAKRGASTIGPRRMVAIVGLAEAGFFLVVYVAYGLPPFLDPYGAAMGMSAGLTGMLGYVLYYEAIARGTISRIGTITAAYPALTVILAVLILFESLSSLHAMGISLLLGSALLLGYAETASGKRAKPLVIMLVILAFVFWGLWGFLVKVAVSNLGEGPMFAYYALSNSLIGSSLLIYHRRRHGRQRLGRDWIWPASGTALGAIGVVLFTLAMAGGPAVLVTPLTGAYPVVTVTGAALLLRERLGRMEVLGLIAFLLGLFAVALG